MTLIQIIEEGLRKNGYDGLFIEDGCACRVGDLCPCGGLNEGCSPGVFVEMEFCGNCTKSEPCDFHMQHKPKT